MMRVHELHVRAVAALVSLAAVTSLSACGFPAETEADGVPADAVPEALRPSDTVATSAPATTALLDIWFVRENRLEAVRHRASARPTAAVAVENLLLGPTEAEQHRALRSAIPDPSVVIDVSISGGVAEVDLAPSFADIPARDQVLALGQLVLTLTDLRGVGRVQFTLDGSATPVPLPSGKSTDDSVSRDDFIELASTPT
jgi:spore germination protein GerM